MMKAYKILFTLLVLTAIPTYVVGMETYPTTDEHLIEAAENSEPGWDFVEEAGQESPLAMGYYPADQTFFGIKAEGMFGEVPEEVTCWICPSVAVILTVEVTDENDVVYSDSVTIEGNNVGQWNYCLFEFNPSPYPWEWVRIDLKGDVIGAGTLGIITDLIYADEVLWDNCDHAGTEIKSTSLGEIKVILK